MDTNILLTLANLSVFLVALITLRIMAVKFVKFSIRAAMGMAIGLILGIALQYTYGVHSPIIAMTIDWISLVGTGYVRFLQMMVTPLIIVSILGAILKMDHSETLGKKGGSIVFLLIATTIIAATISIVMSQLFQISIPDIQTDSTLARSTYLNQLASDMRPKSLPKQLMGFFPTNPFADMAGLRTSSILGVVIFFVMFAVGAIQIAKKKPEDFDIVKKGCIAIQTVVMRMVTIILRWTPYGIMSLMVTMMASSPWQEIYKLITFVFVSYAAMLLMFITHLVLIMLSGLNPITYIRKVWPVLIFAFASRSSASAIPLNTKTQWKHLGVDETSASLSASLGASMGQNGCAGIYPAMLAMMLFTSEGISVTWMLIIKLLFVIAISSFGVAGVGGGATFAAIIVLSIMGLPVEIAGLLISIEPLIDMGRTALNVSGSMTAGLLTSRLQRNLNTKTYNDINIPDEDQETE